MNKQFITVNNQLIHYRISGKGAVILLLHPSPNSSKMMIPLMNQLSQHYTVIAMDIPGCGLSRPLAIDFKSIIDYADFIKLFVDALSIKKLSIYGTATGAQIAIRFGLSYPTYLDHLYLDNTAHFTDKLRSKILKSYFPDLSPQYDASHLTKIWTFVHDLFVFFPWSWSKPAYRLNVPHPPKEVLNIIATDFLQAGKNYDRAYRAAFYHEKAEHIQKLKVPTIIFNWKGSILGAYIDALLKHKMPDNVSTIETPADRLQRGATMIQAIQQSYQNGIATSIQISNQLNNPQGYVSTNDGDLHYYYHKNKRKKTVLILHDWRSSAAVVIKEMSGQIQDKNLLAISLPNHGDSDRFDCSQDVEKYTRIIDEAMHNIAISTYEVIGIGWSKGIAQSLSNKHKDVELLDINYSEKSPLPKMQITADGTYLIKAWFHLKDRILFQNPYQKTADEIRTDISRLDHNLLQLELLEWLKCSV